MADVNTLISTSPRDAKAAFNSIIEGLDTIASNNSSNPNYPLGLSAQSTSLNDYFGRFSINKRTPWIMSTTEWLKQSPPKGIVWAANPSDIAWTLPQRATTSKNMYGTVQHVWPDNFRNTFFDEYRVSITMQTVNLMPLYLESGEVKVSPGIINFYDFLQLFDAPKLTADGRVNQVIIQYTSQIFPKITLMGHFDPSTGIRFSESAASPNQAQGWSVDFIVCDSTPRLSSSSMTNITTATTVIDSSNTELLKTYDNQVIAPLNAPFLANQKPTN